MSIDTGWVDLAPTVEPIREHLREATGQTVRFGEAPAKGIPPFTVLQLITDARVILTLEGGVPAEVTWQLDHIGETPLQALGLADKGSRAMVRLAPPALPGATVDYREAVGDMHGPRKLGEKRYEIQARYRWTLIGAVSVEE